MASQEDKKRIYFIQLETGYFTSMIQKALRKLPGGADMTIAYLKMQLRYAQSGGKIEYLKLYESIEDEVSENIDEKVEIVKLLFAFLRKTGLLTEENVMPEVEQRTKSHTLAAVKKALNREERRTIGGQCPQNVRQNKEQELYTEREIDIEDRRQTTKVISNSNSAHVQAREEYIKALIDMIQSKYIERGVDWLKLQSGNKEQYQIFKSFFALLAEVLIDNDFPIQETEKMNENVFCKMFEKVDYIFNANDPAAYILELWNKVTGGKS
jgi:phage replisome organizer, putative, N-terminal region